MEDCIETDDGQCDVDKDGSYRSSSMGSSSLLSSQYLRRPLRAPNKKKYEEEMEELQRLIRAMDIEVKTLGTVSPDLIAAQLLDIKAEKEASISKRKKIDIDLRLLNQEITKKMGQLSRTESNLHYKNEAKIDDAISKMEWQLKSQNFRLAEERRIVAEVDKLKRSKKVLQEYFSQKKEVDKMRDSQRRMRGEREHYYKKVTNLARKDEELKKSMQEKKLNAEELKKAYDQLYERKRLLFAEFKQSEMDYQKHLADRRHQIRKRSFKQKEEERKAKEEVWQKEMLEYETQKEPFEDEKNLCTTLMSYLQRYMADREDSILSSPRDEHPEHSLGAAPGPADSLDDGMFVLLKKSDDPQVDYSLTNKPRRRSKKGRKLSVTKPLAHTPQIISQFSSLNLNAPSNVSEVAASIEQLQARKQYYDNHCIGMSRPLQQYYDNHCIGMSRPLLSYPCGPFSSSGSVSSLESPLRDRASTWGFVPSVIAENQTPSDAGTSGESGFHDMSRQASKTESSESAADNTPGEQVLEEMIKQSAEYMESETSHSSSDTITPEDQVSDEVEQVMARDDLTNFKTSNKKVRDNSDNKSIFSCNESSEISVFEDCDTKSCFTFAGKAKGDNHGGGNVGTNILNYDKEFPAVLSMELVKHCVGEMPKSDSIVSGTLNVWQIQIPKGTSHCKDNDNVDSEFDSVESVCESAKMDTPIEDNTFTCSNVTAIEANNNVRTGSENDDNKENITEVMAKFMLDLKTDAHFHMRDEITHL